MNKDALVYGIVGLVIGAVLMGVVQMKAPEKKDTHMSMADMTAALKNKSGDDFDKAFIELMIEHHQGAIDMANLIPTQAKHDEIKKLGQDIISAQTKEINEMHEWAAKWGYGHDVNMPMMDH